MAMVGEQSIEPAPERRASMRDVARAAGVSLSSVSLVAAGHPGVSEELRTRTLRAMRQVGYVPRQRRAPVRNTLAIISERLLQPIEHDIFYAEILQGIQTEAQRQGHRVFLHLLEGGEEGVDRLMDSVRGEIDGMILANGGDLTDDVIMRLIASQVPAVLVDNYVVDQPLHCVVADNVTAGYLATRHLLRLGHRRIGLLAGPRKYRSLVDRQEGYLDALTEYEVPVDRPLMPPPTHHAGGQKGYQQMLRLLELPEPPTAVVAISDKTAFGALEALKERGLQIPKDMALVSIDDVEESAHTTPPLTTVRVPRAEMGAEAVRRLLALLRGEAPRPTKTTLYTHLVVRASCGTP
ncbi:MAG TPA: LacI family DNA-binding transcriptional regulator [Chloroflexota bacterium]|nr:LacI family DNA-binding transcriptional regulator [Chloroflexota bacterium]